LLADYFRLGSYSLSWQASSEPSSDQPFSSVQSHDFSLNLALSDGPGNLSTYELGCFATGFNVGELEDAFFWVLSFGTSSVA
jgi:hypothetical protein